MFALLSISGYFFFLPYYLTSLIFFFQRTIMNDPLKLLPVDVTKIRAQDVVVVAAVLVALFLFRAPNVWELKPSWQLNDILHRDHHTTRNKLYVWLSDFFMKLLWQAHCHLNNSVKIQVHSFKFITYLTLYTLKSVYIFSILFSIHLPKVLTRRICIPIKRFFSCWSFPLFSWP